MTLEVELVPHEQRKAKPADILQVPFGTVFTDHMLSMEYSDGKWHPARIHPYKKLELDPSALVLHYGQGIFEGMKAYRRFDKCFLFRPEKNFERFNASATRMVMANIDEQQALENLKHLLKIEKDWIPQARGTSLYIRPTMIATESKLGVRPSLEYLYYVILSPVGPYFKSFEPVKIMVADKYVRAAKGGVGSAKTMGNYAASLMAAKKAKELGYSQVLWLDAHDNRYIEEVGTMNLFIRFDDELATAPLQGTILPGITRDSVIHMTKDWGYTVNERKIPIDEVLEGIQSGKVLEIFGAGTAAVIAPVGNLWYKGDDYSVADGGIGQLTQKLFDTLTGMQCGQVEDKYDWVSVI
ncbi:MAG: branched-chain amino acid aminotransferase [Candidatus Lokiarchaeota archaeon]|nr:branched-chain amino acid aminotransferase [Candidatus Lokiarchaeota archaeon]